MNDFLSGGRHTKLGVLAGGAWPITVKELIHRETYQGFPPGVHFG